MVRCRTAISETLRHRSSFHPRQRRGNLEDLAVGLAQTPKSTDRWLRDRTTLMLPRAFCELLLTDDVVVDDTEAHHLLHVLRLKSGDPLQLFNGCGMEVDAVVTRSSRREVFCTVQARRQTSPMSHAHVTVIAAPPKADRLKWMVEKLTEIGVARLILLQTDRTEVISSESRQDKLRSYVIAACKQCRRNELLQLSPLQKLTSVLDDITATRLAGELWIAHPTPSITPLPYHAEMPITSRLLLIGPEGGFTEIELQAAVNVGARMISWPHTILRIETAAIVFATQLLTN
ncbi:MAG: 16S rRNA (uracil(1498)-N(3))-methyltransferase [Planctomycetota bacterium]|nr:MAG: 16S rRNA (uracil(1498)-N(3))-methyltransferase [Planctomycetota bacterium]